MPADKDQKRTIGLMGATGVGVGGIVGGGVLALSGIAFANTGPSATLAFFLNGVIAMIVALSYAEMSSTFPESGGTYLFSKKVLSIESAFVVGWIFWFASIVAAVLYAIGFASFTVIVINVVWVEFLGEPPGWLSSIWIINLLAVLATLFYTFTLSRKTGGGGGLLNIGKIIVFSILIAAGLFAFTETPPGEITGNLHPFFSHGFTGLLIAMGYTFIAMHGFDLISAVGGEIKHPEKNIPRSMLLSLGISLILYIPLLFIISTVGVSSGQSITVMGSNYLEEIVAVGAKNYMGSFGYWLVLVAGILSMLSALNANIFGASRVAFKMAVDRTLPKKLGFMHDIYQTPTKSIYATSIIAILIIVVFSNVESAGAAASLIFLITFSIAQFLAILIRKRIDISKIPFQMPLYPFLPVIGIVCCMLLAVFQGFVVPLAGLITLIWLLIGGFLYVILFSKSAKLVDASAAAFDPNLSKLRGQTPLVLVPISNPTNAASMVQLASSLAPPKFGKVLLLSVVTKSGDNNDDQTEKIINSQKVLNESLKASIREGIYPEALTTVADNAWEEIKRVSERHQCNSLVLGLTNLNEDVTGSNLEKLISDVPCDVVVLRAHNEWNLRDVKKVLVPVAGGDGHGELLARLLGTLSRVGNPEVEFLKVMPEFVSWAECEKAREKLFIIAQDYIMSGNFKVRVIQNDKIVEEIITHSKDFDLVILGFNKVGRHLRAFGPVTQEIAQGTTTPIVLISHSG
ncbi:MAG: amino acid permease [Thermodesulfobacteriota bacterium]